MGVKQTVLRYAIVVSLKIVVAIAAIIYIGLVVSSTNKDGFGALSHLMIGTGIVAVFVLQRMIVTLWSPFVSIDGPILGNDGSICFSIHNFSAARLMEPKIYIDLKKDISDKEATLILSKSQSFGRLDATKGKFYRTINVSFPDLDVKAIKECSKIEVSVITIDGFFNYRSITNKVVPLEMLNKVLEDHGRLSVEKAKK